MKIRIKEDNFLEDSIRISEAIEKEWYPCTVTIEKDTTGISEKQRNYYFWVVIEYVMEFHWMSKEQAHMHCKTRFLPDYEELLNKMKDCNDMEWLLARFLSLHHDLTITTSEKWEFEEYLRKIREVYTDIPLPNEDQSWICSHLLTN